jgi:6-carboxyhexanoate--CoA ligase
MLIKYNPTMWSIRMRASREGRHISGAEGLYENKEINKTINKYIRRALTHPKGRPDEIVITVESLKRKPKEIPALAVSTLRCGSTLYAEKALMEILKKAAISEDSIKEALKIVKGKEVMRGAALISTTGGKRLDKKKERGVRASRMGITKKAQGVLSKKLRRHGINTDTVKEALILASKVSACKGVSAELCVSDDPDYTTGYIASPRTGYLRIPNIKRKGSRRGGRVFFVKDAADVKSVIEYLEEKPVIIGKIPGADCIISLNEIIRFFDSKPGCEDSIRKKD